MYVDAIYDRENEKVFVSERHNGERFSVEYPAKYTFFYENKNGKYKSIFGDPLKKFETNSYKTFKKDLGHIKNQGIKTFESDIQPLSRCLEENYGGTGIPTLNIAFFDIEVDFIPEQGFSDPQDPFAPITAITTYLNWIDRNVTLAIPPDTMSMEKASKEVENIDDVYLFESEAELLDAFIDLIHDADVLTGWNSTTYDIPYSVNRIISVLSKDHARKLCLWGFLPIKKTIQKHKKEFLSYDLVGRIHLDYLELYMKNTANELHSYRLDYVGEIETGENKTPYEGTLEQLYNNDFRKFIEYNRQDVMIMVHIDNKNKFIDLHNNVAHTNTVTIPSTLGSVNLIDQAIINEAHSYNLIMPEKPKYDDNNDDEKEFKITDSVAGAYVVNPKVGLHDWIGSLDIQSLYPSTIRTFNMSPETLVGQIRPTMTEEYLKKKVKEENYSPTDAWGTIFMVLELDEVYKKSNKTITVDFVNGDTLELSGKEFYELIFHSEEEWCVTANGTIFTTKFQGIIPHILERWYNERVDMKKKLKENKKRYKETGDENYNQEADFWNVRQWVRKILLNSLYGAILNKYCRVYDQRIGQSVTLSGRNITKHMAATVNEFITGEYNNEGDAIIYGDTDSVYFSAYEVLKNSDDIDFDWNDKESIIKFYDLLGEETNKTFSDFLKNTFNVPNKNALIGAARETVISKGLFIKKKRYAAMVVDDEGDRMDINGKPGKIKAMGLEIKRTDTPKYIQNFLENVLELVLVGKTDNEIIDYIKNFRHEFRSMPDWEKGTPKKVNALTDYEQKLNSSKDMDGYVRLNQQLLYAKTKKEKEKIIKEMNDYKKVAIPGHVQASMNYNWLRTLNNDYYSMPIYDGSKIIVCKLKNNPLKIHSIAYPVDETHLPHWFKELPFDNDRMEYDLIDLKLKNIIGILNIDIEKSYDNTTFDDMFE